MGMATIVSGGADGLYTVKLDFGKARKDQAIGEINARMVKLSSEISEAAAKLAAQQGVEDAQKVIVEQSIAEFASASRTVPRVEAVVTNALGAYRKAAAKLAEEKGKTGPLRLALEILKDEQSGLRRDLERWNSVKVEETREAWCADLTEDATGSVATIDVPGDSAQIIISPGAPEPTESDGQLVAREVQTPEQVFWNAAVLPGWQKHMPTFRVGVIASMNDDTANVEMIEAKSSAQNLDINKVESLDSVSFEYMDDVDAQVFEVGDRVIVRFDERDWSKPTIIGFETNPRGLSGGFICRPTSKIYGEDSLPTWWGEPFDDEVSTLGTPFGDKAYVLLQPNRTSGVAAQVYSYRRGRTGIYGPIDWQGLKPSKDVISWDAYGWDHIRWNVDGSISYQGSRWQETDYNSPTSPVDPSKMANFVPRYKCQGASNVIYRGGRILRVMTSPGSVEGAALQGGAIVAVMKQGDRQFAFVRVDQDTGEEETIGVYMAPAGMTNHQCWYFNRSGTKARSVMFSRDSQFAVEASIADGMLTHEEVAGSRGTAPGSSILSAQALISCSVDGAGAPDGGSYHSCYMGTVSGAKQANSPAIAADFSGDTPAIAFYRHMVLSDPGFSGSRSSSWTSDGEYMSSVDWALTQPVIGYDAVISVGGVESLVPISRFTPTNYIYRGRSGSNSKSPGAASVSYTDTSAQYVDAGGIIRARLLDFDLRSGAYLVVQYRAPIGGIVFASITTGGASSTTYTNPSADALTSGTYCKTTCGVLSADTWLQTRTLRAASPARSETVDGYIGRDVQDYNTPSSPRDTAGGIHVMDTWVITSNTAQQWWGATSNPGPSIPDSHGVLRSYYGSVMSSVVLQAGGVAFGSSGNRNANKSAIHVIGPSDTDGAKLLKIEAQDLPWAYRLGVV